MVLFLQWIYQNLSIEMNNLRLFIGIFSILIIFQSCQPLTSLYIETAKPAEINFPGNFNKIVFLNLENDLNDDNKIDTLLHNIITKEMSLGFLHSTQKSFGIDSSRFLYVKGFARKELLYKNDTISWAYLSVLSDKSNADIFIVLDSLKLLMNTEKYTDFYAYPTEYYKYRELWISAYWSVFDLYTKSRLDSFNYRDTLYWESQGYSEIEANNKLVGVEKAIRETAYFAAVDYADRIFPGWQREVRYYFVLGNKDFKKAAVFAKKGDWESASELWRPYIDSFDKEIASRAAYNLAVANEMRGRFIKAIGWAERSNEIKSKSRTIYYINRLKKRQKQIETLQNQIY